MIPAISFFVIRMARKISLIYLPNCAGELTASVLNVVSIFLFLYVLVLLLSKELLHNEQIPLIMESLIVYLIILIAGISALLASSQLSDAGKVGAVTPILSMAGRVSLGYAFFGIFGTFGNYSVVFPSVGRVILAGCITSSIAALARYGEISGNKYVAETGKLISNSGGHLFILGAFIYSYISFIRPVITAGFSYTPLVEWGIVCIGVFWMYRRIKSSVHTITFTDSSIAAKKHTQQIEEIVDKYIEELGTMQEVFVEKGQRDRLLITVIELLLENRWERDHIISVTSPLINYEKPQVPWYSSLWSQNSLEKNEREKRRKILYDIINRMVSKDYKTTIIPEVESESA